VFRRSLGGPEDLRIVDQGGAPGRAKIMERFSNIPVQVQAGVHDVVVTFIERAAAETDEFVNSGTDGAFGRGLRAPRMIDGVTVVGPFHSPGVSKTASRERIFVCEPRSALPGDERACARRILENLARRAFRRPAAKEDIDSLMTHFEVGRRGTGGFDAGIEQAVSAVLVSPDFLLSAIYDRTVDRVREGDSAEDMLRAGVMNGLARTFRDPGKFLYDVHKGLWAHHIKLAPNVV
jgi:hypothetical protein